MLHNTQKFDEITFGQTDFDSSNNLVNNDLVNNNLVNNNLTVSQSGRPNIRRKPDCPKEVE